MDNMAKNGNNTITKHVSESNMGNVYICDPIVCDVRAGEERISTNATSNRPAETPNV